MKYLVLYPILIAVFAFSCKKADGYYDFVNTENVYDGTAYDYIVAHPESFDSLAKIIDKVPYDLIDSLTNDTVTVFAPTNASIAMAFDGLNEMRNTSGLPPIYIQTADVDALFFLISKYFVSGANRTTEMVNIDGMNYPTLFFKEENMMLSKVQRRNASGFVQGGTSIISYIDTKKSDFSKDWVSTDTKSVNISVKNGIIHILSDTHVFGFAEFNSKINN